MAFEQFTWGLTETAQSDLDEICEYITAELNNPEAAASLIGALEIKAEELCRTPKAGRLVQNAFLKRKDIRRILIKHFVVYYLIDEISKQIAILRIIYNKRQQDDFIKEL